jgi:phage/plasmid primase, P4 family, C-terminal domain
MVDFDNIPSELQARDQWLFWNSSSDKPRKPLSMPESNHGASWSDPEEWLTFDEVSEAAKAVSEAGIGYVNAADNSDYPRGVYGVIDLDGVVDDDGHPKDWLPSLAPFMDREAYCEWSPSGEGIHIPIVGAESPDWWSDQHFTAEKHEGVELLTNKFSTFTGAQMDDSGDEVVQYGEWLEEWLAEAYEAVTGEDPLEGRESGVAQQTIDSSHSASDEEWITVDVAEEALEHIDAGCGYNEWRNIGFALGSHFSEARATRLMDRWSRTSSDYDSDSEDLIEDIVSRGDDGGTGIGHLVNRAKAAGWDAQAAAREQLADNEDEVRDKVNDITEDSGDDSDDDSDDDSETEQDDWDAVYEAYNAAGNSDERLPARYAATELLDDEQHWRALVANDVLYHYDDDLGIYDDDGEARLRETLVEKLREQYRANESREIGEQLRGRNMISQDALGGPAHKLCTRNCVIHIERDELRTEPHNPEHEFLNLVETEFDPDADCPRFRAFLKEVVQTGADRKKLQEYAGYVLHHWGLPYHKTLFLVGPTASGKSTFLDTVRGMLGDRAVSSLTPQQMTEERFGGAELFGKMANIRNDIPSETVENTGQFKEISAGDPLKAERKYQDPFHFEPRAKHLFSANQLPETDTDDEAFYRRILLCAFPSTIPRGERDPKLDEKLEAERPGILNWAIEGLQRLLKQGKFTADRVPGKTQDTWEKWANSITRFQKIGLDDAQGKHLVKNDAYTAYVNYCEAESIPLETQHKFTRKLKEQGIEDGRKRVEGKLQRVYLDQRLTERGEQLLNDDDTATGGDGGGIDDY